MSRKEYQRLKKSREQLLIEKGMKLERQRQKTIKKREEKRRLALRKKAINERRKLEKEWLGGTLGQIVRRYQKRGVSLQEFIKMAAKAGVRTRQAFSIWFSPEGAGAGIF